MTIQKVHAKSGCTVYCLLTDCNDVPILPEDVSSISYSIYQIVDFGNYLPVETHQDVNVPKSSILESLQTQIHTGETYNFSFTISAVEHPPFPERNAEYAVEIAIHDLDNEPHIVPLQCKT